MDKDNIAKQLLDDCHYLGSLSTAQLLLSRNATLPWFILVPDTALNDLLDLPPAQRDAVMVDCASISAFIKQALGFDKVNFAGLGNVVAQMHLHIIGRSPGDACWPQPVWGNLGEGPVYETEQLLQWRQQLVTWAGLQPAAGLD
jgi:diadenosine tetraphosphate (Ap4A) HIT family hydrolase